MVTQNAIRAELRANSLLIYDMYIFKTNHLADLVPQLVRLLPMTVLQLLLK